MLLIYKVLECYDRIDSMKSRPRPLCYLWATRKSENWPGRSVVTQTQKVLFLYNCCSTTLVPSLNDRKCCSGRTGRAMEAEWRQSHCHGLLWSPNGGTMIAQWTQLVGLRRYSGDRREAEASLKLIHNVYNSTHFFMERPMAEPCTSILRPRRYVCLPPASFERPVSDRPPRRPLCDCFEHAQKLHGDHGVHGEVWTSSMPPLNDLGNLSASFVVPLSGDLASFVVAQGRHKGRSLCVKRV